MAIVTGHGDHEKPESTQSRISECVRKAVQLMRPLPDPGHGVPLTERDHGALEVVEQDRRSDGRH